MIPLLILILLLLPFPIPSQAAHRIQHHETKDKALIAIHKKWKRYDSQREEFKKTTLSAASQTSPEGSTAYAYRGKSGKLLIVDETYFAEMGQATWSYYFEEAKPFYVLVAETAYAYPITVNAEEKKKLGGGEDKTTETRYYFKGGKLIRWLDGKKTVPAKSERFRDQAKSLLELAGSAYKNAMAFSAARH